MQIPATLPRPAGDLYAPGWLEGAPTLTTVVPVHPTRAVLARSAVSASVLAVSEVRNRADFMRLEQEWNALVASTHDEPFYRHEFVRVWLDNFAPGERPRFLLARTPDGALAGALPLIFQRTRLHCAPVRRLHAAANEHSCRFDMLATNRSAVAEAFVAHLRADRSWDVLILTDVPRFANAWALEHSAKQSGLPTGEWVSLESPHFALPLPPAAPGCAPSASNPGARSHSSASRAAQT